MKIIAYLTSFTLTIIPFLIPIGIFAYHQQQADALIKAAVQTGNFSLNDLYSSFSYQLPKDHSSETRELLSRAVAHLQYITRLMPSNSEAYRKIGRLYLLLDQPEPAIDALSTVVHLVPNSLLARIELGFAYERLMPPQRLPAIQWSLLSQTGSDVAWLLPNKLTEYYGWWSPITENERNIILISPLILQATLVEIPTTLVFYLGINSYESDSYAIVSLSDGQRTSRLRFAGRGWHPVTFDLPQRTDQLTSVTITITVESSSTTGIADIQVVTAQHAHCVVVECLKQAADIWKSAGLSHSDFTRVSTLLQREMNLPAAIKWYQRSLYSIGDLESKPDILPDDNSNLTLIDSFVSIDGWQPCPWCIVERNGEWTIDRGVLKLSFLQDNTTLQGISFLRYAHLDISPYKELVFRVRGDPSASLTVELVIDGARSRVLNYYSVSPDWELISIPISGHNIRELLLSISERTASESLDQGLYIDWIALR